MSYVLPKGPVGFTSGEQITSEKMNALGSNQNDMANKVSEIDDYYGNLPEVAKTGLYSDLKDAPAPIVPADGKLTIKVNGVTSAIFSANQSEDSEVDILTSGGEDVEIVQTTGDDPEAVMSQAATTNALNTRASVNELDNKANKATTLSGYGITDAYTKTEVDGKLVSVFTYKGSVATVDDLPSGAKVGDVYNVQSDNSEYVWDGEEWNNLGGVGDLSNYYTKSDIDSKLATKANTANTISGYGIVDAYTKEEVNTKLSGKANTATTLAGYGITDAYTKTEVDEKVKDPVYIWDFPWGAAGPNASSYQPTLEEYNELNQAIADGKQIVINTNYEIDGAIDRTLTAVDAMHYDATIGGNTTDVVFIEATEGSSVTEYKIHLFAEDGFAPDRVTVDAKVSGADGAYIIPISGFLYDSGLSLTIDYLGVKEAVEAGRPITLVYQYGTATAMQQNYYVTTSQMGVDTVTLVVSDLSLAHPSGDPETYSLSVSVDNSVSVSTTRLSHISDGSHG